MQKISRYLSEAFNSIRRGKMEQIFLAYVLPRRTAAAIMMLYKNTKLKVRSPDGDIHFLKIVAGVLQGDTLAPYVFIISQYYILRTSIDLKKENSKNYLEHRLRTWHSVSGKYTSPNQIPAAGSIGLHENADKTEDKCFNQKGDISIL